MKYLAILLTALTLSTAGSFAQNSNITPPKFGHINSQELLDTLEETKVARLELEKMNTEFEDALKEQEQALVALEAEIRANQETWSEFQLQTKYSKYQDDQQRLQESFNTAQQQLVQLEQDLLSPIIEKARAAIKKVGEDNGFTYIFDLNNGAIIYDGGGEDVLPLVIKELGL